MATTNGINGCHVQPHLPHALDGPQELPRSVDSPSATNALHSTMERLQGEVSDAFGRQLDLKALLYFSKKLQVQLRQHLKFSEQCMLPSFNYHLPTGQEKGIYLALEVGGSNLRIAMVELAGRQQGLSSMSTIRIDTCPIGCDVKQLASHGFFDWMAERVKEMLHKEGKKTVGDVDAEPLRMGVAWSFPIESVPMTADAVNTR